MRIPSKTLPILSTKQKREWEEVMGKNFISEAYLRKRSNDDSKYENVDIDIAVYLKQANKAFRVEKYVHTYPHCWRTDKPILYYLSTRIPQMYFLKNHLQSKFEMLN